jgi:hypothetical protein
VEPLCDGGLMARALARVLAPTDGDERSIALGWLAFHRDTLRVKCADLTDDQLAARSSPPSDLSLLGLVRHMTEMERVYGVWANGPKEPLTWVWGEYADGGPEPDFRVDPTMAAESFAAWERERAATDARIATVELDAVGGNGRSLRWNLTKLIGEYARHNGHADLVRELLDGRTGE